MAKVIIIGGGVAGMMAAGTATRAGHTVTVLEHSRKTLLKLGITGKGRCNLTNDCDVRSLVANTPHGGKFLYGAFTRMTAQDVMDLFESLGVRLKTERGNRVFPVSDRAFDVVDALRRYASGAKILFTEAKRLCLRDGAVYGVETTGGILLADHVILATGGCSYPATGSDGSGYALAHEAGHTIIAVEPSLVPFQADPATCAPLAGLTLKNVTLTLCHEGKPIYVEQGELLFTHTGISGPLVLSASVHVRGTGHNTVSLDLKPALDEPALDARLLREIASAPNVIFSNLVPKLLPKALTRAVCDRSGIAPGQKINVMTRAQRAALVRTLKNFSLGEVKKCGFDEAIVTSGGVATTEVDPKTMRSKLVSGLSFAGEILDVDAYTGGFNLQIAWATGYAAAKGI